MRRITMVVAGAVLALGLVGCGGGSKAVGCDRWDDIAGTKISNAEAASVLLSIADTTDNMAVRNRANELAVTLSDGSSQAEVHIAFQNMDAACEVS